MTDAATSPAPPQTPEEALAWFHSRRELSVVQPAGSLALVARQLVDSEQEVWGVPGRWAPLAHGESGLRLVATAADGILVDGEIVDGEVVVAGIDTENARSDLLRHVDWQYCAPTRGYGYLLRIWDAASDAIENFGRIDAFPV